MGLIFGLILALICPMLFLGFIRKSDFYQIGQFHLILISLGWGIFAYLLASLTNKTLEISWLIDRDVIDQFIAPVLEEILKGMILLYLIRLPQFTYSVDGALYGFATGIGFAIIENIEYITHDPATAVIVAFQRIFSANLVHASSSAILGIALGIFHLRRTWSRWLVFVIGLFLAIDLHMFYNIISQGKVSFVSAFGIGLLSTALIYLVMLRGKKQAQAWIKQKLGMNDRVTRSEVAMVDRLDSTQDIFLPVLQRFGAEKASQVEKLLYLQARLGIKRKALDSFQENGSLRNALEAEISKMQTEMDSARRTIGAYTMSFVRGLYTEEMVSVWDRIQAKMLEGSALNEGQKGGGLWTSLEERLQAPRDAERRK